MNVCFKWLNTQTIDKQRSFKHFSVLSSFMTYHRVCNQSTRRVALVERELLNLPEHMSSHPVFRGVRITRSLVLCVVFCRSLFVRLSFFFSPLCGLSLFDLQILITHLVSANSSICHNSQNAAHSFSKCNISITTVIHDRFKYICKNWKQNVIL